MSRQWATQRQPNGVQKLIPATQQAAPDPITPEMEQPLQYVPTHLQPRQQTPQLRYIELCAEQEDDEDCGYVIGLTGWLHYGEAVFPCAPPCISLGDLEGANRRFDPHEITLRSMMGQHEETWQGVADVLGIPLRVNELWEKINE